MGVHDADYDKIKKLLGVPKDEPIIVFRAQDKHVEPLLARYEVQVDGQSNRPSQEWFDGLAEKRAEFAEFREQHPDRMKTPD